MPAETLCNSGWIEDLETVSRHQLGCEPLGIASERAEPRADGLLWRPPFDSPEQPAQLTADRAGIHLKPPLRS